MDGLLENVAQVLRLDLMAKLGLATLLGGAIGLERELSGKPAGLRTNILICIGAVMYTEFSIALATTSAADPTRVAAQIVTGVGFLGAGTILHSRGAVVGLTSAATIWVVAAIGVALGAARYLEALGSTALVLIVLAGLRWVERAVERRSTTSRLIVHAHPHLDNVKALESVVRSTGLEIVVQTHRGSGDDLVIEWEVRGAKRLHDQAVIELLHHSSVRNVSMGE
jgi:putative Mg2+ transporter-C (MgtC) family protein